MTTSIGRRIFLAAPGNLLLWLIAAFHMLLLAALFVAFLAARPAAAEDTAACTGRNLMVELQQNDPARYAEAVKEADATPNGKGIFWKIEKAGLQPSWLLGSMHVTDPRVLALPPRAQAAHDAANTIIIESDEILDERKATAALLARPELTMFTDGTTIDKLLSPEDYKRLETGLKQRGIPLGAVSRMRPWMISSAVALPACEIARKAKGVQFLDQKIATDAVAQGKQVKGLETLAEQIQAMADLPIEFHLKSLIETLELGDKMSDVVETMTDLYLSGDIGMTMPMLKTVTPEKQGEDSDYAAFEQRVILDRNKVMAERAAPILDGGNVFMAVGALHLPGKAGIIELLRQQGFTLTAVN
ncbi:MULTISPECIES: TraB/GumN family protein [unclassified Rhizobium]|uniref:TraB/GumN family protein n=1 Tax=unclassified Rhizobium TaxID=2613769 RepID=UPI0007E9FE5F|nr:MULTISPECIES: TraB/GumN family protein [unclassified Rhizobium]ANM12568.1 TraB family protein [Rhizobium sp. N324]ANM18971.1 TraB family protein [Rhizobium sp. N541]ANM25356.1 TraB family protein [Rhizobium sp. N941]OYD01743.1 TraB family protein [Rhizobium sp. N4311]